MIGYWHNPVVRLSVRIRLCIVALRVGYRAKSCTSVSLGKFLFVHSDTFICRMYHLAIKRTEKYQSKTTQA